MPDDFAPDALSSEWWLIDTDLHRREFEEELRREVRPGHLLSQSSARAIAVRKLRKEVIFWLPTARQWAWVHLTWAAESDPRWPTTVLSDSWAQLMAELTNAERA